MSWNHRVVKNEKDGEVFYAIHEVYYDDDGNPHSITENPIPAFGKDITEITHNLIHMMSALTKPVLDYTMFIDKKKTGDTTDATLKMFGDK